ncbi:MULTISPECIES: hypothetical protein [Streptomyces]|uniref:hypothetical protein n=1 Tax=Streptomyces TaxID=1883 RepID=UPI00345B812C
MTPNETPTFDAAGWPGDPGLEETKALAAYISAEIPDASGLPESRETPTGREMTAARSALLDIAQAATAADTVKPAQEAAEAIEALSYVAYHQRIGDLANRLRPAGYRLLRTARQAAAGGCRLGGEGKCSGPERVRLFVYNPWVIEGDPGCPRHAAEEARSWDHGGSVEVVLVGEEETCRKVRRELAEEYGRQGIPLPRWGRTAPKSRS